MSQNLHGLSELSDRIAALRATLAEKETFAGFERVGTAPPESAEELSERVERLFHVLPEDENSTWSTMRHEFQRDLKALETDVDHWMRYIDNHYRDQQGAGQD